MPERDTLKDVLQNTLGDRGFDTSIGRLLEVDSVKNRPKIEYVKQADNYRPSVREIERAIDSVKQNPAIAGIESSTERPLLLDKIREKIEVRDLLEQYYHPRNSLRLRIEREPSIR